MSTATRSAACNANHRLLVTQITEGRGRSVYHQAINGKSPNNQGRSHRTGLLISVATDVRHGRVLDRVTMPCMATGILLNTLFTGWLGTGVISIMRAFAGGGL